METSCDINVLREDDTAALERMQHGKRVRRCERRLALIEEKVPSMSTRLH